LPEFRPACHSRTSRKCTFAFARSSSRHVEWCDVKLVRRGRNVTVCDRDGKRVVNIATSVNIGATWTFLDISVSVFGWTLIHWCWKVIDTILWDQLYTVAGSFWGISHGIRISIWNFNQDFGGDIWSLFEQILLLDVSSRIRNHVWIL